VPCGEHVSKARSTRSEDAVGRGAIVLDLPAVALPLVADAGQDGDLLVGGQLDGGEPGEIPAPVFGDGVGTVAVQLAAGARSTTTVHPLPAPVGPQDQPQRNVVTVANVRELADFLWAEMTSDGSLPPGDGPGTGGGAEPPACDAVQASWPME